MSSAFALQFNMLYMSICTLFDIRTSLFLMPLPPGEQSTQQALPFEAVSLPFCRFRKLVERAIRLLRSTTEVAGSKQPYAMRYKYTVFNRTADRRESDIDSYFDRLQPHQIEYRVPNSMSKVFCATVIDH